MWALVGRPAVSAKALEFEIVAVLMDVVRQATPSQLVTSAGFSRGGHAVALGALGLGVVESSVLPDPSRELLACGAVDTIVSALDAMEEVGADDANGTVVSCHLLYTLKVLDGEALDQVYDKLRAASSALRYAKTHKMAHYEAVGMTSGVLATIVAANIYGKDEDNTFGFTEEDIDGFLTLDIELMRCATWGGMLAISPTQCRGMLNFCIS